MTAAGRIVVVLALALAVPSAFATQTVPLTQNDRQALRIVKRDWCELARYDRARRLPHLHDFTRRGLLEARHVVQVRPWGCRLAQSVARRDVERLPPQHAPWLRARCPRQPLPLRFGDRTEAARRAAAAEPRSLRPVVWSVNGPGRLFDIARCGRRVQERTAIVGLTLTGYLPSASLSMRVVAVSHLRRYGWRVWLLLH